MRADDRKQGEVIVQTIASFLNSDGGILYIGVDNADIRRDSTETSGSSPTEPTTTTYVRFRTNTTLCYSIICDA